MSKQWHGGKGSTQRKAQVSKERQTLGWELLRKGLTESERARILARLEELKNEA